MDFNVRNCIFSIFVVLLAIACQQESRDQAVGIPGNIPFEMAYDSLKAKEYGADDYGMKKYVMAFLQRGPNRSQDSLTAVRLQTAHMKNITRMAEEGKLVLAGPFFGDGDLRGIYIFNVQTIAEAEALTNSDPAIQAGSLAMELKEWYGPAGLMAINEIHASLAKKGIVETDD